jgi:hypothetical protein
MDTTADLDGWGKSRPTSTVDNKNSNRKTQYAKFKFLTCYQMESGRIFLPLKQEVVSICVISRYSNQYISICWQNIGVCRRFKCRWKVNYTGLPCVLSRTLPQHEELNKQAIIQPAGSQKSIAYGTTPIPHFSATPRRYGSVAFRGTLGKSKFM